MKRTWFIALGTSALMVVPSISSAAVITFSAGGDSSPASIQATVDAFRAALGDPNNANNAGPLADGRREINWDGGGSTATALVPSQFTGFFNTRGALNSTDGTGFFQVPVTDNDPLDGLDDIANAFNNASYDGQFSAFSAVRIFTPIGSTITDVTFIVPGTGDNADPSSGVRATVSGFGSIFSDVDFADSTQLQFFNLQGHLIWSGFALPGTVPNGSLSFLGAIVTGGEGIARVRITTGTHPLSSGTNEGGDIDLAVMDDFLYAEPQAVPEPTTVGLLGLGVLGMARRIRRRNA